MSLLVMSCHLFLFHLQYVALTVVNSLGFLNYYSLCVGTIYVNDIHIALVRIAENSTREKISPRRSSSSDRSKGGSVSLLSKANWEYINSETSVLYLTAQQ